MSRTPIREAIRQLSNAGLVILKPFKGATVAETGLKEIRDSYALRSVLERFVTELAVPYITVDIVNRLQQSIIRMETCILNSDNDREAFSVENSYFHSLISERCPNRIAVKILQQLSDQTVSFRRLSWRTVEGMQKSVKEHQLILDAIKAGDASMAGIYAEKHTHRYEEYTHNLHDL